MATVVAKSSSRPKANADGTVDLYGLRVPGDAPRWVVELQCYRENAKMRGEGLPVLSAHEHFKAAWRTFWPDYEWSEWAELVTWAWCEHKWIVIIGHQRASKTFSTAHCAYLDYCAQPFETLTSLVTVTFDALRLRLWSDVLRGVETAKVQQGFLVRNSTNEMRLFPQQSKGDAAEKFQIHGMAIQNTKDAEGRVRGGHAPRRRYVIDEAENVAKPVYDALVNPMSAPDAKAALLTNPMLKISELGKISEPEGGWGSVRDTDLFWKPKRFKDGIVLHFDGLQSPNVKAGKAIFTGLLTQENVDEVRRIHGEESPQWWSLIRGWPAPDGMVARLFRDSIIEACRKPLVFDWRPVWCATLDPAFEFDQCVLHLGEMATPVFGEKRYKINAKKTHEITYKVGEAHEDKDYQLAHECMRICREYGVKPEHFIMDCSGGGRGVYAILRKEWSREIHGIDYGGAATDRTISADDNRKCDETFKYFVSELWGRAAEYCRSGLIGGLDNLHPKTMEDLAARQYSLVKGTKGTLVQVESKAELKKRLGRSPDHGDAAVQFAELLCRLGTKPGQHVSGTSQGDEWTRHRARAAERAKVYADEGAYRSEEF